MIRDAITGRVEVMSSLEQSPSTTQPTDPVHPSLRRLCDQLTEAAYDAAHEGCDDECTGGGHDTYTDLATRVLIPVIAAWIGGPPQGRDLREVADAAAQRIYRQWERMPNRDAYVLEAMREVARAVVIDTGVESLTGEKAALLAEAKKQEASR